MKYWLLKTEPNCYSIDDLARDKGTHWDGVRNYMARNYMRDDMKVGDPVLIYHSSTDPTAVVGRAEIAREGYADYTAQDPNSDHYDPKSTTDNPIWMMVDIKYVETFKNPVTLQEAKADSKLDGMVLTQKGSRLSVQPVTKAQYERIVELAGGG